MRVARFAARAWVSVFLLAGVVLPLAAVLREGWGFEGFWALRGLAGRTFVQAAVSAGLAMGFGLVAGLSVGRSARAGALWLFPYSVPTVVAASVGVAWLGRGGWLARLGLGPGLLYSFSAVVLIHVFLNAPWIALRVAQVRREIPREQEEAARVLGAPTLRRFQRVVWPQVRTAWLHAGLQAYCLCAMSFVLVLLLGGGPPVDTLETALYARVRYGDLDLPGAAACALWELLLTAPPALWLLRHEGVGGTARPARAGRTTFAYGAWSLVFVGPYVAALHPAAVRALVSESFWREAGAPLAGSLALAAVTAGLALGSALALIFSPGRAGAWLGALPAGLSTMVLGLGAWLAYGRWLDPFDGSFVLMGLVQAVVFLPFAYRWLRPLRASGQTAAYEAARTLGASEWRAWWRIEWPRYRGPVRGAFALVFAGAAGEASAAQLFAGANFTPVSVLLTRAVAQYRFEEAQAGALLLLLVSAAALALAGRGGERSC